MKRVTVRCDARGKLQIEMQGFQGEACLKLLEELTSRLGKATTLTPTADFYLATTDTRTLIYEENRPL